jgi:PiT family inorganic phosphate transporter
MSTEKNPASAAPAAVPRKSKVDKDLKRIVALETATQSTAQHYVALGMSLSFLLIILAVATIPTRGVEHSLFVVIASVVGGYMALNIGANDVANNVGPAVGAQALTMLGALVIAAVCEAAGALIAGGEVVNTVSKGIIDPARLDDPGAFVLAMTAALLAGALWINLATWLGAPVSTTHAIVGGVLGGGIAAAGMSIVNWKVMGGIAASWVVSPVLGGLVAALLYFSINILVIRRDDMLGAAARWVPLFVALMAGAFSLFLVKKGLGRVWKPGAAIQWSMGAAMFVAAYALMRPWVRRRSEGMENRRKSINRLFVVPLVVSAGLLSFAHGANDVANAVGPLAAVGSVLGSGHVDTQVTVPFWVMAVGAVGISAGLVLFGPRVIRIVGEQITKLDPIRAFCIALSAAVTVIAASAMGLPVSSTHIAVGGVFGVGFFREVVANRKRRAAVHAGPPRHTDRMTLTDEVLAKKIVKAGKRRLVRRVHLVNIAAAWVITVPAAAALSAGIYLLLSLLSPL